MQHWRMYLAKSTRNDADRCSGWEIPTSSQPVHAGPVISCQPMGTSIRKEQGAA